MRWMGVMILGLVSLMPYAWGRTLTAGPGGAYALPSAAIAAAKPGDVVRIAPGHYQDCATLNADHVTIEGGGAVLASKICQGKAILVIGGRDDTVRDLTLTGATVPDGNGAGIRAQGGDLTVDHVTFTDDQDGLLAGPLKGATIAIIDSRFRRDGSCVKACAHGVYVGAIKKLIVRGSDFSDIKSGHAIKSRALSTVIENDTIRDGAHGTSSYLVDLPNGGNLLMRDDRLEKGPNSSNSGTAISIGEEGGAPDHAKIIIEHVRFHNRQDQGTTFVRNLSHATVVMRHDSLHGDVTRLAGPDD
jgi:hypothetical protein